MSGSGAVWQAPALVVVLALLAVGGCGGSSERRTPEDNDRGGSDGMGGGATAGGGTSGAVPGGAAVGGSAGNSGGGAGAAKPIQPPGPSYCGGEPCDPPLSCCMTTGECFDPSDGESDCAPPPPDDDLQGRRPCASNAHCGENELCKPDVLLCGGAGHCQAIDHCISCVGGDPGSCRTCGCDGNTYPDPQTACLAGVYALYTGAACGEPVMGGVAGSSGVTEKPVLPCGTNAQCPVGRFCCALPGLCYLESDRDICIPPPPGARLACKRNGNCAELEYCRGEGCESIGGCVPNPGTADCGVTIEPVCGCDGTTYTSPECAASRGVRVDHDGECGGTGK